MEAEIDRDFAPRGAGAALLEQLKVDVRVEGFRCSRKAGRSSADRQSLQMAFRSLASERFWKLYSELPAEVQRLAEKQYELFAEIPSTRRFTLSRSGTFGQLASAAPTG